MIDTELNDLMQSIAKQSLSLMQSTKTDPKSFPAILRQFTELTQDFQSISLAILAHPEQFWKGQMAYFEDAFSLLQDQMQHWMEGTTIPMNDPRFSATEWTSNPFFSMLSQHYLLASEHFQTLMNSIPFGDNQLAKRVKFFTQQFLDALSPANFFHTNPQIIAETVQSHGKNLLYGLQNLLSDLEAGPSKLMIKMTDTSAFSIGENLAITPGKVIFRNDLMELIQYTPTTKKVCTTPLLMIPPWINKYYILDLSAKNSFVKYIVEQGITVFMISWVNPDKTYANKGLYSYLRDGPFTALKVIQDQLNVKKVNTLGFCIGGTLQAMMLAYAKTQKIKGFNSATFLASMIDFSDAGDITVYIDEQNIRKIEETMKTQGFLDGKFMANAFNSLRANDLIWSFFIKNYLKGQTPVPFDILYWNSDSTNLPAKMHSQYLRWMYLHNRLIKPGKIKLNHIPIDVHDIDIPTFFVSTQKDHIAPWETTYTGFLAMNGTKEFLLGGSGHIAGIVNPPENNKYKYYTNSEASKKPEDWLKNAKEHAGSWWPYWVSWLKKHSGKQIDAPEWTTLPLKGLIDAPGRYVLSHQTPLPE